MLVKIVFFLCCLATSNLVYGEGCPVDLSPHDDTSKYIEALKCLAKKIDNLQTQIDGLKTAVAQASSDAASAQAGAADAKAAAERAAQYAQDTNYKLDKMFRSSMKQ